MQLGFVSAILPELSLEEVCEIAQADGYDCVELCCWPVSKADRRYAGVTHVDVNHFGTGEAERVHEIVAKYGVTISGLGYYPNPLSPHHEEAHAAVEHIRKVILAAELLGVRRIVVQTDVVTAQVDKQSPPDRWADRQVLAPRPFVFAEQHRAVLDADANFMLFGETDDRPPRF